MAAELGSLGSLAEETGEQIHGQSLNADMLKSWLNNTSGCTNQIIDGH